MLMAALGSNVFAQPGNLAPQTLTWDQIRDRFQASNPTLRAAQIGIDESRSQEITAYLRPNPDLTGALDQINPFSTQTPPNGGSSTYAPFAYAFPTASISYCMSAGTSANCGGRARRRGRRSRRPIRGSREEPAVQFAHRVRADAAAEGHPESDAENLAYYDRLLDVSNDRLKAGDIARVDYQRLELQRVQFETDVQTATVNLRTAKIQLLMLLNDRTPVEQFDVTGTFDFSEQLRPLEELRRAGAR